jgi:hypothetical protein
MDNRTLIELLEEKMLSDGVYKKATNPQLEMLKSLGVVTEDNISSQEARQLIKSKLNTPIIKVDKLPKKYMEISQKLYKDKSLINKVQSQIIADPHNKFKGFIQEIPLLISCDKDMDFEIGWQPSKKFESGKMLYFKSYDLLMVDFDILNLKEVKYKLSVIPATFRIYKTTNGYHAYLTSKLLDYRSGMSYKIMSETGDIYYALFSGIYGYKIRLNPKIEQSNTVEEYIETVGQSKDVVESKRALKLLKIKDYYMMLVFNNINLFKIMSCNGFYQSFIDILNVNENVIKTEKKVVISSSLRQYILQNEKNNLPLFEELSIGLKYTICKPQRLLKDTKDYYIACDLITNTYYICYKELMMIDIDGIEEDEIVELISIKAKEENLIFELYRSRNGFHAFCVNKKMNYEDINDMKLSLELGTDYFYALYTHMRGWSVRLNKKGDEKEELDMYTYHSRIQMDEELSANTELIKLVELHFLLSKEFSYRGRSKMC